MPLVMLVVLGFGSMASVAHAQHARGGHHVGGKSIATQTDAGKTERAVIAAYDDALDHTSLLLDGDVEGSVRHVLCFGLATIGPESSQESSQESCTDLFCNGAVVLPVTFKADPVPPRSAPAPGRIDNIDGVRLEAFDRPPCISVTT
jgi:hypothetical protein